MLNSQLLRTVALSLLLVSQSAAIAAPDKTVKKEDTAESTKALVDHAMIDPTAIDTSIDPCTDFYQYACGNWLKRTPLPADKPRYSRSFNVINDRNLDILREELEKYSKGGKSKTNPNVKKVGDFYASCMNDSAIAAHSKSDLKSLLTSVDALKDKAALPALAAKLHLQGIPAFFSFGATPDIKEPTVYISEVDQGGYTLPDATYYHSQDKSKLEIAKAYQEYIANTFKLLGEKEERAAQLAKSVYAVESALTAEALPPQDLQDPTLLYHIGDVKELNSKTTSFNWEKYFADLGITTPKKINITEAKFMNSVEQLIKNTDLETLKQYLRFETTHANARYLDKKMYNNWFQFAGVTLNGQKQPLPRWKQCITAVSGGMGEAVGQAFVERAFSTQAKERIQQMIDHLRIALGQNLKTLDWLDDATREKADEKLKLITRKIGFPDKWRDYSKLSITRASYLKNILAAEEFEHKRSLNKIGGPVDPTEWYMTPHEVNAYYEPTLNQINFPAGILQPPFFSDKASDAINYGSIGLVIGHEMTHGFDTVGSKFDGHGKQSDWWSAKVKKHFEEKAACLEKQYSEFEAIPGLHVNGHLTVTENIADNGGLKIAYRAYKLAAQDRAANPATASAAVAQALKIEGDKTLSDDQQFFLSTAQGWCTQASDQAVRNQVSSNPHSPAKSRINGSVINNPDFAAAYQCKEGTVMAPKNRCAIW